MSEYKYLEKLQELTGRLPTSPHVKHDKGNYMELVSNVGITKLWDLFSTPEVSISRFILPKDNFRENHVHVGYEILFLIKGKIIVRCDDKENVELNPLSFYYIKKNTQHAVYAKEESEGIAVTIPAEESYHAK